ncbi:MAG: bifunctional phosphoglucose/phosphomannose isomerase [Patescibacteria group bacterium]
MAEKLDEINFESQDKRRIIDHIEDFSNDCLNAWKQTTEIALPLDYQSLKKVVLLGMGGSGIAGETIKELLYDSPLAIEVIHDYDIPGYVDANTLVVANSYSGNTEETIIGLENAIEKGAKIIALTTGGKLADLAHRHSFPLVHFGYDSPPRMAFAYSFTLLLAIFVRLGQYHLPRHYEDICHQVRGLTESFRYEAPLENNPAKKLAGALFNKMPIICATPLLRSIGLRFKCQLNESAKALALVEFLPEMHHNGIEGFLTPKIPRHYIILRSKYDRDRNKLRADITAEIIKKSGFDYSEHTLSEAADPLAEHLALVVFCDYVSYYLAILNGVDPDVIDNIKYLKSKLQH